MKIEVRDREVQEEEIKPSDRPGAKQFKPFTKRTQVAYAHTVGSNGQPDAYPTKFRIGLNKDQAGYEPGVYQLGDGSFYVDRNGNLVVGRLVLEGAAAVRRAA